MDAGQIWEEDGLLQLKEKKKTKHLDWKPIDFEKPWKEEAEKPAEEEAKKKHSSPLDWSPIDFERPWKEEADNPLAEPAFKPATEATP